MMMIMVLSILMPALFGLSMQAPQTWIHAPMAGVLSFGVSGAKEDGVVSINGTRDRELSYPKCDLTGCTLHFAMPVS